MIAESDQQGRLSLPENVREQYGEKFHIVTDEDGIERRPVADDPLAVVHQAVG